MGSETVLLDRSDAIAQSQAVAAAIAIPAHVVQAKGNGHAGTAMALAPLAHVLFTRVMRHNPADPQWRGRDRFVLSAGHASLLLYVQLFFTGYGLTLDDIAASRRLGSLTPGHPEYRHTVGVEMSTGPLGQGVASAVGMAIAARHEAAIFGGASPVFDHTIWVIAGDGCLQEGVSGEASSLAGTLGLENLVLIWDDNGITIDGHTTDAFTEDVRARYRAYGWRVLDISDSTDLNEIEGVLRDAADHTAARGRPTFIAVPTVIGFPSRLVGGTPAAHAGGFGEDDVSQIKHELGFARDATLEQLVTPQALAFCRRTLTRGGLIEAEWDERYAEWAARHPDLERKWCEFNSGMSRTRAMDAMHSLDALAAGVGAAGGEAAETLIATRTTNGLVMRKLSSRIALWGGSADLSSSTNVTVPGRQVSADNPGGEFIRFGIREHAMGAILNGIALHGPWRPFGSTYLVFSDYLRPAIRLAALMALPVIYVFTHDSVAVGEDGPTHQPVEQIASLRAVPELDVVRPADAAETIAVWRRLVSQPAGPTALILSRQGVPVFGAAGPDAGAGGAEAAGVARGGYVVWQSGDGADLALIASGSEVALAIEAAAQLSTEGVAVRVVSMPCVEWFIDSGREYIDGVLPPSVTARVAIEAGRGDAWWRWVGTRGAVIGVEQFGVSGSGPEVMAARGITVQNLLETARRILHG